MSRAQNGPLANNNSQQQRSRLGNSYILLQNVDFATVLKGDESFVALATRPPFPRRFLQTFGVGGAAESNPLFNKYYIPIPGLNSTRS